MYWLYWAFFLPFPILLSLQFTSDIISQHKYRIKIGFPFSEHDVDWDYNSAIKHQIYGFFSGVICGCLGLGGGTLLGPLFLHLNFHPNRIRSTSNFLVMITSFSSTVQFCMMGMVQFTYGIPFAIIGGLSALLGNYGINLLIGKIGRPSIPIICLGLLFSTSLIAVFINFIINLNDTSYWENIWAFHSPCPS